MKKLKLSDIKKGSLVNEIRNRTVEFIHNGEQYSVDVRLKTLPFIETDSLYTRMNNKENVVSEWLSKTLVDAKGELEFTEAEIDSNFVQPMANAIFQLAWGTDSVKKSVELMKEKGKELDTLQENPKSSMS